jgi:acyl dehydratase
VQNSNTRTDRWYEDFEVGETIVSGGKTMTESEMTAFAWTYDPQPIHIDVRAAEASAYGGLIGSGWQLGAIAFRLFMSTRPFAEAASLGSPGCDELRWLQPVRPGDTVYTHVHVADKRLSKSKPDRGLVNLEWNVVNQNDETLMTMKSIQLIRCRA